MLRQTVKRLGQAAVLIAVLLAVGWLVFVPWEKESGYEFAAAWGGKGAGPGRFRDPTGIAIAGEEVFVADARNGRIQVFGRDGVYRREFGGGEGPEALGRPMNLAIAGDTLYVADYWHDRIAVFGLDGTFLRTVGGPGSGGGEFRAPGGVAVAANGDIFVADFYNHRIQRLDAGGRFIRQWGTTGKSGTGAGEFLYPTDVALTADGGLIVADGYADRIQTFAPDGSYSHKWGGPFAANIHGPFNGWFATVTSVATDAQDHVFVADFYNNRIQKFAADGTFLTAFGEAGTGKGEFDKPVAVAVAEDGTVYVADFGNNRIQVWRKRP